MIRPGLKYIVRNYGSINRKRLVGKTKNFDMKLKTVSTTQVQDSVEISNETKRISLMFAHRCLFRCNHCYFWQYPNRYDAMELEDWVKCIDDIYGLYGNNVQIELGGDGTAEINKGMIPLIKKASSYGIRTTLPTNGYLINKQLLKRIIDAGINCIAISLDFLSPELHDKQRGSPGSFLHVLNLLEYLKELKTDDLNVVINSIIMDRNLNEITKLAKWVKLLPHVNNISYQCIIQPLGTDFETEWYLNKKYSYLWPNNTKKVTEVINELIILKKKNYKIANSIGQLQSFIRYFSEPLSNMDERGCNSDLLGMQVYVSGKLQICSRKGYLGSLKENSIKELLSTKKFYDLKEEISNCSLKCHQRQNCRYYE